MDGRKAIFSYDALTNEDGILEVITIPRHKCDTHVLPQSKLTEVNRRTISNNISALDAIALMNDRTLINTGVLVRSRVFSQIVDIDSGFAFLNLIFAHANNDTACIDAFNKAATFRNNTHT